MLNILIEVIHTLFFKTYFKISIFLEDFMFFVFLEWSYYNFDSPWTKNLNYNKEYLCNHGMKCLFIFSQTMDILPYRNKWFCSIRSIFDRYQI